MIGRSKARDRKWAPLERLLALRQLTKVQTFRYCALVTFLNQRYITRLVPPLRYVASVMGLKRLYSTSNALSGAKTKLLARYLSYTRSAFQIPTPSCHPYIRLSRHFHSSNPGRQKLSTSQLRVLRLHRRFPLCHRPFHRTRETPQDPAS